jgi:quinol monooxygenase YgiN
MIGIVAEFVVKKDKVEEFLTTIKPLVEESNKEAGCIKYELHKNFNEDNKFAMMEEWKDQTAIDFHNSSKHFTTILPQLDAFMSEHAKVSFFEKVL